MIGILDYQSNLIFMIFIKNHGIFDQISEIIGRKMNLIALFLDFFTFDIYIPYVIIILL